MNFQHENDAFESWSLKNWMATARNAWMARAMEGMDCRRCQYFRDNGPIASCGSAIRCVDGSRYRPGVAVRLWETTPEDYGF